MTNLHEDRSSHKAEMLVLMVRVGVAKEVYIVVMKVTQEA
jgi:hypothetical protein